MGVYLHLPIYLTVFTEECKRWMIENTVSSKSDINVRKISRLSNSKAQHLWVDSLNMIDLLIQFM